MNGPGPQIRILTADLPEVATDGLAVGLFEGQRAEPESPDPLLRAIARVVGLGDFHGKFLQTCLVYPEGFAAPRLLLVGLGKADEFNRDRARKAAGAAATRMRDLGAKRAALRPAGGGDRLPWRDAVRCAVEGAYLGLYQHWEFKTEKRDEINALDELSLLVPAAEAESAGTEARDAAVVCQAVNWIRTLVNRPGNALTAAAFAEEARAMAAERPGIRCTILGRDEIRELGMGCFAGVNAGSADPPRLIVLEYDGERDGKPLALVGKGITFDTGGLDIKAKAGMEQMKDDMSGGAAVVGTIRAAADLGLPIRLVGIVPATDNMPGSHAIKPGDVLKSYSGLTVEVGNTDAEGRLVLADGLAYACKQFGPRAVVDMATLTGSVYVALGSVATGMFTLDDRMARVLEGAAEATGERIWRLPLWPEHEDLVDSDIADIRNQGEPGDSDGIAAAVFLKRFVGDLPWVHLDIAGTSWADKKQPYIPKGGTGVGVRLLIEALRNGL
ncbi:MAG: leucyl aminopeptidase [Candidatus Sericytochromatia bacterium]|nr:leucyl aminopeptidase [Candidatus Tanganyikabacteria bacterium]